MRSKKAFYNIVTKVIAQLCGMVSGLITPKLLIEAYGSASNGTVSAIVQFLSLISFMTLGVAGATRVSLYETLSKKDILGTSRVIKTCERYMHRVGLCLIVYSFILACTFPMLTKTGLPFIEVFVLVLVVSAGLFSQYYFGQTFTFLLQADQTEYIATIFRTIAVIIDLILVVIMVRFKATLIETKFVVAVVSFLTPFLINRYCKKRYCIIKDCEPDPKALSQRKFAMFHSIANVIHEDTDVFLLTLFTDTLTISVYSVYYGVIRNIKQLMQNFTTGLEGAFGSMWAKNEEIQFVRNFNTYEFLMFAFSSVIFTSTGVLIIPFMKLYTHAITDVNYIRPLFAGLVVLAETAFCIRQPYVTIVQAAGKYKETKNGAMVEALINLGISLVLVYSIGLNGVIVGTIAANIFRTVQYALYSSNELLHRSIIEFMKKIVWHIVNSLLIVIIMSSLGRFFVVNTWSQWIIFSCGTVCVSMFVTLLTSIIIYNDEVKRSWCIVRRMVVRNNRDRKGA